MSLDEEKLKSRDLWDRLAPAWHRNRETQWDVTRRVGEWLVDRIAPEPGHTILDIAAGPGETGFAAARLVGPEGKLISTDFAAGMVDVARARADELGLTNVEIRQMDAEDMDLPDDHVDGAICRWGFMLMTDPVAALRETRRVLKEGGNLAFSVWGGPGENPWVTVIGMVLTQRGLAPQADPFGPGGMYSMSEPAVIETMVKDAGYDHIDVEEMPVRWRFETFDDYWNFQSEMSGGIATLLQEMGEAEKADLRRDLEEAVSYFRGDDGYDFPGLTRNVHAR